MAPTAPTPWGPMRSTSRQPRARSQHLSRARWCFLVLLFLFWAWGSECAHSADLGVKNATPELKYRLGEENKIMRVSKRVMITAGSFLLAAALGFVLFPNAAHGIVAALVQVTNTAANPVPISDI